MDIYNITFSPTGGTKKVAEILAKNLGGKVIEIDLSKPNEDFNNYHINQNDLAVIAAPSYGGRAPEIAMERLGQLNGNGAKAVIVSVYGNRDFEDTLLEINDKAKESGFNPIAGVAAIAEHSILPQYAKGRPDLEDKKELIGFTKQIKEKDNDQEPSIPGNRPYKKISSMPLIPKSSSECNRCNICITVCPVGAIDKDTLKTDKTKCISCMRCIKICPQNARKVNKLLTGAAGLALKKEASKRKNNQLFL